MLLSMRNLSIKKVFNCVLIVNVQNNTCINKMDSSKTFMPTVIYCLILI